MGKGKDLQKPDHKGYRIGPALAIVRDRLGITQPEAAKAVGVHKMTLSEWERGEARVPADALLVLLPLYGISFEDLPLNGERAEPVRQKRSAMGPSRVAEPRSPGYARLSFDSPIAAQRSRVWLEAFLLELAESGADADFIDRLEAGARAIQQGRPAKRESRGVRQGGGTPVPRAAPGDR